MKIQSLFAFTKLLDRLGAWVIILIATGSLTVGILLASILENRAASLALAVIASLVAGFIYALNIPKALASYDAIREKEFKEKEAKLRDALNQQKNLESEVARYKTMHLNVDGFRPILKLNLLSIQMQIRDYLYTPIHQERRALERADWDIFEKEHRYETELYNLNIAEFTAHLGVDLQKLKFSEIESGKVKVTGFRQEFQGFQNPRFDKELALRIDRVFKAEELVSEKVLKDDGVALKKGDEMQAAKLKRLNEGVGFANLDSEILKMTKAFLEVIFAPLNIRLSFDPVSDETGLPLVDFLETKNRGFQAKITELESKIKKIEI